MLTIYNILKETKSSQKKCNHTPQKLFYSHHLRKIKKTKWRSMKIFHLTVNIINNYLQTQIHFFCRDLSIYRVKAACQFTKADKHYDYVQ